MSFTASFHWLCQLENRAPLHHRHVPPPPQQTRAHPNLLSYGPLNRELGDQRKLMGSALNVAFYFYLLWNIVYFMWCSVSFVVCRVTKKQSGFEVVFQHLDGHDVRVTKTGVTSPGDVIQMKKEGMPRRGSGGKTFGSLFIRFSIVFPKVNRVRGRGGGGGVKMRRDCDWCGHWFKSLGIVTHGINQG